jgi:hypothetical protein
MATDNRYLIPPKAPMLPLAPMEYSQQYIEQLTNVLRLYFNQLDNTNTTLLGENGGQFLEKPYGLFFSTVDQTAALANTAYAITFPTTYFSNSISIVSNSRVTVVKPGVYSFTVTAQVLSSNSSAKTLYMWINRGGTDIGYSTRTITLSANGEYAEITWDFIIDVPVPATDYIELRWATTDTAIKLDAAVASSPHPGIPSVVLYATFVSPLPAVLPTPP